MPPDPDRHVASGVACQTAQVARPFLTRYCWWYSSAFQKRARFVTSGLTIGFYCCPCSRAIAVRAADSCAGERKKTALRYWSPTSGPWRFFVVGSWFLKKTLSKSRI